MSDLNKDNFQDSISSGLVLVDFWAAWCAPCKALTPLLEEIDEEVGDKAKVNKVNVDENQELAMEHGIRGIPTVKVYKDGEEVESLVGLHPKDTYLEIIKKHS